MVEGVERKPAPWHNLASGYGHLLQAQHIGPGGQASAVGTHGDCGQRNAGLGEETLAGSGKKFALHSIRTRGGQERLREHAGEIDRDGQQRRDFRASDAQFLNRGRGVARPGAAGDQTVPANDTIGDQTEQASQHGKRRRGQPWHNGQKTEQGGRNGQCFGLGQNLAADVLAQMTAFLFRGNPGHDNSGRRRDNQGRDLRH